MSSDNNSNNQFHSYENRCKRFFTTDGKLYEPKVLAKYCKTSVKEIKYIYNGIKLQSLLESLSLQNQNFKKQITPILNYINMRIESENTDYNYLSVKFDTKKHSKLDKFFNQRYCLSLLENLINYCNLNERDVINILLRNSLYKDPNALVYRTQVCSLIDILKRDKFTHKDLKTIQKSCPHLFVEKHKQRDQKVENKERKVEKQTA